MDATDGGKEGQSHENSFLKLVVRRLWLAGSVKGTHQQSQVTGSGLQEHLLVDVVFPANPQPIHAPGVELMREVPLHALPTPTLQPLPSWTPHPPPVGVHGGLFRCFPSPVPRSPFRFGNIGPH